MNNTHPVIHTSLNEEDWQQLRSSRFTASEIHKLMGTPKNKSEYLTETAKSFVFEKAAEYLTGAKSEIYGRALDWGKAVEHLKTGGLMTDITSKFDVSPANQKLLIGEK